jgi:hypothetical protein
MRVLSTISRHTCTRTNYRRQHNLRNKHQDHCTCRRQSRACNSRARFRLLTTKLASANNLTLLSRIRAPSSRHGWLDCFGRCRTRSRCYESLIRGAVNARVRIWTMFIHEYRVHCGRPRGIRGLRSIGRSTYVRCLRYRWRCRTRHLICKNGCFECRGRVVVHISISIIIFIRVGIVAPHYYGSRGSARTHLRRRGRGRDGYNDNGGCGRRG